MATADLIISTTWLSGIKAELARVVSAAQARAALDAAIAFLAECEQEIRSGDSWFLGDPWRATAIADLVDQKKQLRALQAQYPPDSTASAATAWLAHSPKVLYAYSLGEVSRRAYPADADSAGFVDILLAAPAKLSAAILAAPGAVLSYAGSLGQKVGQTLGQIGTAAAAAVRDTAEAIIPWRPILFVVGLGALAVCGIVYMHRAGVRLPKVLP